MHFIYCNLLKLKAEMANCCNLSNTIYNGTLFLLLPSDCIVRFECTSCAISFHPDALAQPQQIRFDEKITASQQQCISGFIIMWPATTTTHVEGEITRADKRVIGR